MSERELIRKCQNGHQQAQRELFDCYGDRFYRLAFRYLKSREDAEDTLMTAFVKIFRNIGSFDGAKGNLESWLRAIVVNEALMLLRRRNNFHLTESLDAENPVHEVEVLADVDGEHLYALILELPEGYRTVFNLHVIEGFDHAEIAAMLSITESTSRSQLFKAKQLLRRRIRQEDMEYGT